MNSKAQKEMKLDLHARLSVHTCGCGDVTVQSARACATHHADVTCLSPAGSPTVTNGPVVLAAISSKAHNGNTVIQSRWVAQERRRVRHASSVELKCVGWEASIAATVSCVTVHQLLL